MPKVSVIIPVYNTEKFLRECLDSVINQTLKDIEIVCVDDGSTDNSLKILDEYKNKDNRIKIFTQANKGSGPARNLALKNSNGKFVVFLDSDDFYVENDILETLVNKAEANSALVVGGEMAEFENGEISQNFIGIYKEHYLFDKEGFVEFKDYQFDFGYVRFLYKRQFLIENDLYFPPYLRFQDPPFFVKAMHLAEKFYAIDKITYTYRVNHKELIWTKAKINGLIKGLLDILEIAKKNNYTKLFDIINERFYFQYHNEIFQNLSFENLHLVFKIFRIGSKKYCLKYFLMQIFSIANAFNREHKIITILGVKLKIRRKIHA